MPLILVQHRHEHEESYRFYPEINESVCKLHVCIDIRRINQISACYLRRENKKTINELQKRPNYKDISHANLFLPEIIFSFIGHFIRPFFLHVWVHLIEHYLFNQAVFLSIDYKDHRHPFVDLSNVDKLHDLWYYYHQNLVCIKYSILFVKYLWAIVTSKGNEDDPKDAGKHAEEESNLQGPDDGDGEDVEGRFVILVLVQ